MNDPGTLYVVGTPIGNLEDITLRALRVLAEVDVIACEDTRRTRKLLARHGIATALLAYHEHNERDRAQALMRRLAGGEDVALVADAGMPGISDPGYRVVTEALAAGVAVVPVPGPSAVTAALSVAGLPTDRFLFVGFLPRTPAARRRALQELAPVRATLVLFEAPHRIRETLRDIATAFGERSVALVREATKLHEEVLRGTAGQVAAHVEASLPRGEITLIISGAPEDRDARRVAAAAPSEDPKAHLTQLLSAGMSRRDAARVLEETYGIPRRTAYRMAADLSKP